MGNTLVRGGAPAIQIAGALSDGILIQNLSPSAPLYLGYDPSINSNSFSGFVTPGGSYTTPKGKDVWLFAIADCSVVYDYTPDAQPGSGSNFVPTNQQQSLYNSNNVPIAIPAPSSGATLVPKTDVSTASFLFIDIADTSVNPAWQTQGLYRTVLQWYDFSGNAIETEYFDFISFSKVHTGFTVKGRYVKIDIVSDQNTTTRQFNCYISTTTQNLLEFYDIEPYYAFTAARRSTVSNVYRESSSSNFCATNFTVPANSTGYFMPASRMGRFTGSQYAATGTGFLVILGFSERIEDAVNASLRVFPGGADTAFDTFCPRAPIFHRMLNTSGAAATYTLSGSFSR